MIKLYIDVSDIIQLNRHTKYDNCGLHVDAILFYNEKLSF